MHVYVAPFVYTRLSLIDLATFKLVRSRTVQAARPCPATITTEQELAALVELLGSSTTDTLPHVDAAA